MLRVDTVQDYQRHGSSLLEYVDVERIGSCHRREYGGHFREYDVFGQDYEAIIKGKETWNAGGRPWTASSSEE